MTQKILAASCMVLEIFNSSVVPIILFHLVSILQDTVSEVYCKSGSLCFQMIETFKCEFNLRG